MLRPTDTVQRAEAVGRPACFYFFAFRWCTTARLRREEERGHGTGEGKREKERETTRLDEALAACGIIKIQPCTNCWPVLPLLLLSLSLFPPPLYPFSAFSWFLSYFFSSFLLVLFLLLHLFSASSTSSARAQSDDQYLEARALAPRVCLANSLEICLKKNLLIKETYEFVCKFIIKLLTDFFFYSTQLILMK